MALIQRNTRHNAKYSVKGWTAVCELLESCSIPITCDPKFTSWWLQISWASAAQLTSSDISCLSDFLTHLCFGNIQLLFGRLRQPYFMCSHESWLVNAGLFSSAHFRSMPAFRPGEEYQICAPCIMQWPTEEFVYWFMVTSLYSSVLRGRMPLSLSLLIALHLFLHFIVSDKQPSPEDMSQLYWLLVQRGKHSLSPSLACVLYDAVICSVIGAAASPFSMRYTLCIFQWFCTYSVLCIEPMLLCKWRNKNLQYFQSEEKAAFPGREISMVKIIIYNTLQSAIWEHFTQLPAFLL